MAKGMWKRTTPWYKNTDTECQSTRTCWMSVCVGTVWLIRNIIFLVSNLCLYLILTWPESASLVGCYDPRATDGPNFGSLSWMNVWRGSNSAVFISVYPVLQIRRGKMDNSRIIFHVTCLKHMLRPVIRTRLAKTVLMRGRTYVSTISQRLF